MTSPLDGLPHAATTTDPFTLETGNRIVRVRVDGEIAAKQGAMVAYRGDLDFAYKGAGGVGRFIRKAVTGEGQDLMRVRGTGEVWLADAGNHLAVFRIGGEGLIVNGRNLVALDQGMSYEIRRTSAGLGAMVAGGLFSTEVRGSGHVCVSCIGTPLVLPTDEEVHVDAEAAVCWTSQVQTEIKSTFKAGALVGRSSGELFQIRMSGTGGFVVVQAGEPAITAVAPGQ
jgi:uncharacterized protein (AIM24 family)